METSMKFSFVIGALLCLFVTNVFCDGDIPRHWALLVAGSNEYMNYRHQADICHAYHVVRNHGIPDERIVVMMYDDIAHNSENPFPGNIINEPDGPNVYPGVLKDYTKEEVTPEVFLKVLTGDEEGVSKLLNRTAKVIKSGPKDHVFVNFADHGSTGLIAFPKEFLYADDLNNAILEMHSDGKYGKMVFYIEACESGSMFQNRLRDDINVFITTAANPDQSSYACYFDEERGTYLGDVYSVNWMQDSDVKNLSNETLQRQYKIVKRETNTSQVMEYGDLSMKRDTVGEFQGNYFDGNLFFRSEKKHNPNIGAVPSEDVQLEILRQKVKAVDGVEKIIHRASIKALLAKKAKTRGFFKGVVQSVSNTDYDSFLKKSTNFIDFKCYKRAISLIREFCPGLDVVKNDYALRNLRVLANLCETNIDKEDIWTAIKITSKRSPVCKLN